MQSLSQKRMQLRTLPLARLGRLLRVVAPALFALVKSVFITWLRSGSQTFVVPQRTLSTLFEEQGLEVIDCLKVDVEGAEIAVRSTRSIAEWSSVGDSLFVYDWSATADEQQAASARLCVSIS
jgi:FkbM family methyltransferase